MEKETDTSSDKEGSSAFSPSANGHDWSACLLNVAETADKQLFGEIYRHFAPRVRSYLLKQKANPSLADDLTQEVLMTVWRKAKQFDASKAAASTWIFTIARNRYIDAIRKQRTLDVDPDIAPFVPDAPAESDEGIVHRELSEGVAQALSELSEEQAQIVRMSFMQGLTHGQISEQLNIPLGTVKSRLRLAFGRLRSALEDHR